MNSREQTSIEIDIFILIGGKSTRLGRDKAFVEVAGEAMALRVARVVQTALEPQRITFVSSDENQFNADLVLRLGKPVIADLKPGFGAWSGLDTALGYAQNDWMLVLACDLPNVSAEMIELLAAFLDADVDAVVPRQPDGRLQPLCAIYRVEPSRIAAASMFDGRTSPPRLNKIFDHLRTRIVDLQDYRHIPNADIFFLNVNTEADFKAAS